MSIISSITAFFLSLTMIISGWWNGIVENQIIVTDNAASAASAGQPSDSSTNTAPVYPSLLDIINSSLERLRSEISSSSTTDNLLTATNTPAITESTGDLAEAIVNIQCIEQGEGYKKTISGTGFFISETGVILTNAHVGQFVLLEKASGKGHTACQVKTGATSAPTYDIDLLYISPSWLLAHADLITELDPKGTGENDFALLYVTGAINGAVLPERFPFLPPATSPLTYKYYDSTVILVGYPINGSSSRARVTATTTITDFFTFESGLADIMSLGASPLGHQGASGGPVIDYLGRAIGVITTKQLNTTVLNAITIPYIDRILKSETGFDLASTIQGNLTRKALLFNETVAPILQELLESNLR